MNKQTNVWAVSVNTAEMSETVQRLAFSFGYKWIATQDQTVRLVDEKFLVMYPDNKSMGYSSHQNWIQTNCHSMLMTFNEIIKTFKTPPVAEILVKSGPFGLNQNGDVVYMGGGLVENVFTRREIDQMIADRQKAMGVHTSHLFTLVNFRYATEGIKLIVKNIDLCGIAVVNMDCDHIKGYDVHDGWKFKTFLIDNVCGQITYHGNIKPPETTVITDFPV